MNKAASLAVKSLLGVGSVAGAAGGGVIFWKRGFSRLTEKEKVSENLENKENREEAQEKVENLEDSKSNKGNQMAQGELQITGNSLEGRVDDDKDRLKAAEDLDSPEVKAKKEEEMVRRDKRSKEWKDERASRSNEEASWLPKKCNSDERGKSYSECDLSEVDLKKIKFVDLEDGEGEVKVSPTDNVNVKLKILQLDDFSMKYTFINDSKKNIVIARGDNSVTLKAEGNTEFFNEKNGLAMVKLKDYGIPESCLKSGTLLVALKSEYSKNQNVKQCILSEVDLSKIKFHGFSDGEESVVTPIWLGNMVGNWKRAQNIILTINDGKYGFYNIFPEILRNSQGVHRPIKITRGDVSVTLDGNMESEFTVVDDSLKKVEVTELGFPKNCEIGETEQNKTCELSDNDIRRLKFKETGVSPDLWDGPVEGNKKMNLKIEKTDDNSTYPDGKKYILSAKGDYSITIYNTAEVKDGIGKEDGGWSNSLQFDKDVEKTFKNEDNYLVLVG